MDLTKIINPITCPVCKTDKVFNQRGTHETLFECGNGHLWDVADGKPHVLGGAINLSKGRWRLWTEGRSESIEVQVYGPIMIEALRLQLAEHYKTDDVKIVAGQRIY